MVIPIVPVLTNIISTTSTIAGISQAGVDGKNANMTNQVTKLVPPCEVCFVVVWAKGILLKQNLQTGAFSRTLSALGLEHSTFEIISSVFLYFAIIFLFLVAI